ncbi:MAG: RICIN domain-containing protein [Lachnospiraceae bacterium]|nr:RICIN domain-containing protein [Lachnospiraceae bacterium]
MKKIISAILAITLLLNGSVCFVQGSENTSDYVTEEMFSSEYSDPENNEANIQEQNIGTSDEHEAVGNTFDESTESTTDESFDGVPDESTSDVTDGNSIPGTDESMSDSSDTDSTETPADLCPLEPGLYFISDEAHTAMVSIKGNSSAEHTNVQMGKFIRSNARIFEVSHTEDGTKCIFRSLHTGLYLASDGSGNAEQVSEPVEWTVQKEDGAWILFDSSNMGLYAEADEIGANISTSQSGTKWDIIPTTKIFGGAMVDVKCPESAERANGQVNIPKAVITLYGYTLVEGTDYTADFKDNGDTGELTLRGTGDYTGTMRFTVRIFEYLVPEGTYRLSVSGITNTCIGIKNNGTDDGVQIVMGSKIDSNVRLLSLNHAGDNYYTIQSYHTKKYLTPENTRAGARIVQKMKTNSDLFLWSLTKKGKDYLIQNKKTGTYLSAGSAASTSNVVTAKTGSKWTLLKTKPYIRGAMVDYAYEKSAAFDYENMTFQEPAVEVSMYGTTLEEGTDFTAVYTTDIESLTGTVILKGKGKYQGNKVLTYSLYADDSDVLPNAPEAAFAAKTFYIRPADDSASSLALGGTNAVNNLAVVQKIGNGEKFHFTYTGDGCYKIITHNINFALYEGEKGSSPLTIHKAIEKSDSEMWRIRDFGDGTYAIVSAVSNFAITRKEGSLVLYPSCALDSQKFILEETGTAWKNRQVLSNSVKTYTSDGVYEWTFIPNTTDTIICLTKEDDLKNDVSGAGIHLDMKKNTLSLLKGFPSSSFKNDLPALKTVSLSQKGITIRAGSEYCLTMTRSNVFNVKCELLEISSGKRASVNAKLDAGRGWGVVKTRVLSGSLKKSSLKTYTSGEGQLVGIIGDSFTEAASLGSKYEGSYVIQAEKILQDSIAASARGGAKSAEGVEWLKNYYLDTYHPKYLVLEFGMNDDNYNLWLSNIREMIALTEAHGITPILMTVPPSGYSQVKTIAHRKMSEWVMTSGYQYLDFEYLMTENGQRQKIDLNKYLRDGTHPVAEVHAKIAQQLAGIVQSSQ